MATAPATQTKAVAKVDWEKPTDKNGLEKLGSMLVDQINKSLPKLMQGQGAKMVRALILTCQKTPKLMGCSPISLFGACLEASRLGLEIGGQQGHAYLLPFGSKKAGVDQATLVIGYKGLADLAWRSGKITSIEPGLVKAKDAFEYKRGTGSFLDHKEARGDRGLVELYYVVVKTVFGSTFDVITLEDAIAFRNRYCMARNAPASVRDNSPWYDIDEPENGVPVPYNGFHWMAWKTIIRRISKLLPSSVEFQALAQAVAVDEASERGELLPTQESVPLLIGTDDETDGGESKNAGAGTSGDLRRRMDNSKSAGQGEVIEADGEVVPSFADYLKGAAKSVSACDGSVDFSKLLDSIEADLVKKDPKHVAGSIVAIARRGAGVAENAPIARFNDKSLESGKKAVVLYLEEIGREAPPQ